MKTNSIKRGTPITTLVEIKLPYTDKTLPVGTLGMVLRRRRDGAAPLSVQFKDAFSTIHMTLEQVQVTEQTNKKPVKVGDIFYSSWGYDQTNIDFYKVAAVKNQTVTLRKLNDIRTYTGPMQGTTIPDPNDNQTGGERNYRLRFDLEGNPSVKLTSYSGAWPYNGEPKSFSEWA